MGHDHEKPLHEPAISWRWRTAAVAGNLIMGALELVGGRLSTLSVTVDGIHNIGDAATYNMQAGDVINHHQGDKLLRRRKIAHWIIAAGSAAAGLKAGIDLVNSEQELMEPLAPYAAGGSLAMTVLLATRLAWRTKREHSKLPDGTHCHVEKDLKKHMLLDGASAAAALAGVFLHKQGINYGEQAIGLASGAAGAWMFRPTRKNLDHAH